MDNEEIKESANAVRLKEVLFGTLRHWPWILLSVILCLSVAGLYICITKPQYIRTAKLVFNDLSSGGSINSQLTPFAEMGMVNTTVNQYDEVYKLQSYDVISEVVKRLNLQTEYTRPDFIGNTLLYGSKLPVTVDFSSLPEDVGVSMRISISQEGKVNIKYIKLDNNLVEYPSKSFKLGSEIETAIGPVKVSSTAFYRAGEEYSIDINHISLINATLKFSNKIKMHLADKYSNTLEIISTDNSPERAADLINNLIDVYNERWIDSRNKVSVATNKFINERLVSLERELGSVDADIANYQSEHLLPDVQQAASIYMMDNQNADKQLLDLNNQLQISRYMRQYLSDVAHTKDLLPSNSGIGSNAIELQIKDYNEKLLERSRLGANSSDNHPIIKTLDSELMSLRVSIIRAIDNEIESLITQLSNVRAEKGRAQSHIADAPAQANHLQGIERQQKVKESLYLYLLQKREENELGKAYIAYNTEVVLKPFGTNTPVAPRKIMILGGAFLCGLLIPFGINYLIALTNTTIRGRKDLENSLIPIIGEIPQWKFKTGNKNFKLSSDRVVAEPIVVEPGNRNIINDAFRVLRANIRFLNEHRGLTLENNGNGIVSMLTSINAGNGKSFITANLGVTLALREQKVIIVDGDLRHASSSELVDKPIHGLTDYLGGKINDWRSLVVTNDKLHGAYVLPVGKFPPNPTELLESKRLQMLIDELRKEYDYILIDCPPVTSMADARLIQSVSDNCIFVVRVGMLKYESIKELDTYYNDKIFKNMSLIINGTHSESAVYGYKDSYHYGVSTAH